MKHQLLYFIAKVYQIKLIVKPFNRHRSGSCDLETKTIYIYDSGCSHTNMCTLFHELGHLHCIRTGKWKHYHNPDRTAKEIMHTAWRAENWVDRWAEKEYHRIFPNGQPYECSYRDDASKKWLKSDILGAEVA